MTRVEGRQSTVIRRFEHEKGSAGQLTGAAVHLYADEAPSARRQVRGEPELLAG